MFGHNFHTNIGYRAKWSNSYGRNENLVEEK
jgi:hypothetical protein